MSNEFIKRKVFSYKGSVYETGKQQLPYGQAGLNALYSKYSRRAASKGLPWELTKEQFKRLTQRRCLYCDSEPSAVIMKGRGRAEYTYNGVDRKDSSKGYVQRNCVPCCWTCNSIKASSSIEDLFKHLFKMLRHFYRAKPKK